MNDCSDTKLGHAWQALDGSGKAGKAVIQGVVDGQIHVAAEQVNVESCESENSCYAPTTNSITLNASLTSGGMAELIAHEYTHSTQSTPASYSGFAHNELAAWDAQMAVHRGMQEPYRSEASGTPHSGATFGVIYKFLDTAAGRQSALRQWETGAQKKWPGFQ